MAVSGIAPFVKVLDSNGVPIVGAVLKVYSPGTTTPLSIYSDSALTIPLSNPLTGVNASNASGDFPRFYMAAGLYKLRAETSTGTLIWEWDNIDSGTPTGGALPIASGGTGSTTAAAALTALGAAATSDVTALAAQIATFSASLQSIISEPQGRLTLTSGTPIISTGVSAGTSVFYTPYLGTLCPVFDGAQFNIKTFAERTLTLNSNYILNSIYDCFIINDASAGITLVTGPAWSTITAGAGARGSGGGTTDIVRQNGIWVNTNAMATARNGATTYNVAAKCGTYVGSIYIDGTAGQVSCLVASGQSRKWGVWNAYNRNRVTLLCTDATSTWNGVNSTVRQSNGAAGNFVSAFMGLPEEYIDGRFVQTIYGAVNGTTATQARAQIGIGLNVTNAFSGFTGENNVQCTLAGGITLTNGSSAVASYTMPPSIGLNNLNACEAAIVGTSNNTFVGGGANMVLSASWMA